MTRTALGDLAHGWLGTVAATAALLWRDRGRPSGPHPDLTTPGSLLDVEQGSGRSFQR